MRTRIALALGLALWLGCPALATAQGRIGEALDSLQTRADALEEQLRERLDAVPLLGPLARRLDLSGSWIGTWYDAASGSPLGPERTHTWDARVFADLELARELAVGEQPLLHAVGVSFEWEYFRLGRKVDQVGEAYLDVQGIAGSGWLNAQVGRFQIPVGESYLRFGRAWRDNPFLSNPVSGTWWWDEGIRLHGAGSEGRLGYVASISSGETEKRWNLDGPGQVTLKIFGKPTSWLHLSASALWAGALGTDEQPASGALWIGETWPRSFGSGSPIPNIQKGRAVADAPGRLARTLFLGADAILTHPRGARLWLSYGNTRIDATGSRAYDRSLHGWVAELVLEGRLASPELRSFWLALRASGVGTYDGGEGYLLDVRYTVPFGYDMRSLEAYSLAVGWRLTRWSTLRVEYTFQHVDLVGGAAPSPHNASYLGASLGLHF